MNATTSEETPTSYVYKTTGEIQDAGGKVGVGVEAPEVEDKGGLQ